MQQLLHCDRCSAVIIRKTKLNKDKQTAIMCQYDDIKCTRITSTYNLRGGYDDK